MQPNYSGQPKLLDHLSERVIELMLTDPADRVEDAAFDLIDALTPPGGHVSRVGHVLCALFEAVAVGLQTIIEAPGAVIDELVGDTVAGSRIVAAAVRVLLKRAVQSAATGVLAPLVALHLKACALAVIFCPASSAHTSLEKNCAAPFLRGTVDQG